MSPQELLLQAIQQRQQKNTEFNGGILTADRYVRSISECVGSDLCYRYASKGNISFDDLLKKSSKVLTYNNPDMVVEDIYGKDYTFTDADGDEITLPKNTLMVFKHVLTTPKKDRDGDIMRTEGAKPDPKMLLLWQHVATLPIGKMLKVYEHNSKRLVLISSIVDMNDLSHDAAVMVDNGMGRFSHGFRALEFNKMKADNGMEGGFDVTSFEIMEESLVSIPSNTDAETTEILVGLTEGGKLTSPLMKAAGKAARSRMNKSVVVATDVGKLKLEIGINVNGKSVEVNANAPTEVDDGTPEPDTTKTTQCSGKTGCGCGCGKSAAPKEADLSVRNEIHTEEKQMKCPKCDGAMHDGVCTKCGYKKSVEADAPKIEDTKTDTPDGEKVGRTVSAKNQAKLQHAHDCISEVHDKEHLMSMGGKSLCREAMAGIKDTMGSGTPESPDMGGTDAVDSVATKAMADFLAEADVTMRTKMRNALNVLDKVEKMSSTTKSFKSMVGSKSKS